MQTAIVVGAGMGGLAAASLLAKNGYSVTLLEKNNQPGGRAMVWEQDGFRFDMGPSWYMTPQYFEQFMALFGKKPSDYYQLKKLDPAYSIEYAGQRYEFSTDMRKLRSTFEAVDKKSFAQFTKLLGETTKKYELTEKHLLFKPANSWFDLLNPRLLSTLAQVGLAHTYHREVAKYIDHKALQAALEFFTIFLGGSQYNMPAVYTQLLHMVFNQHIWYPMGGFGEVSSAFASLATEQGVMIRYNQPVTKVLTESGVVTGVVSKGKPLYADVVVSNTEIPHFEQMLEPEQRQYSDRYWDGKVLSPATLLIFLGLNKRLKGLTHHMVVFRNTDDHLESVFTKKSWWPTDPSYYVSIPSLTDRSIVPKGSEAVMLLVPLSPQLKPDDHQNELIAKNVLQDFERIVGRSLQRDIVYRRVVAHQHFIDTFNSYKGGSFGLANTFFQTAWLRPSLKSKKIKNLYHCGHYTVPGVGFPTSLISGQLAAEQILQDHSPTSL